MRSKSLAFFSKEDSEELREAISDGSEEAMERALELVNQGDNLEASMALVKNLRLQQISSGWFPSEEIRSIEDKPSRLKALLSLLEATEGKALIFSRFRADLDAIQEALGEEAVSYRGGMSDDAKEESKRRFMKDPNVKYFIGQPRTAGIGHTLTAASNVIFYSNDPALRFREECEKRAHRKGQEADRLFICDLLAAGTHDVKVLNALREKKDVANEILRDPEGFFLLTEDQTGEHG
jgi:SNF2 family DNA or RNA helicase